VIAIIGIISALATPAHRHAMFKVERGRMLHTLQMISEDELLYQRDHGTYYPAGTSFGGFTLVLQIYRQSNPIPLEGQDVTLPAGHR